MWCPVPLSRNKDMETRQTGRCLREYKAQLGRVPEWFEYHASYAAAKGFEGRLPSLTEADHINMGVESAWLLQFIAFFCLIVFFTYFRARPGLKVNRKMQKTHGIAIEQCWLRGSCIFSPPWPKRKSSWVRCQVPLGVCGLITPWNHPVLIAAKKISVALAAEIQWWWSLRWRHQSQCSV